MLDMVIYPRESKRNITIFGFIYFSFSILLLVSNLICLQYWLKAADYLGWLPTYDHPDPKELGWERHHAIVGHALDIMILGFFISIVFLLIGIFVQKLRLNILLIILGVLNLLFTMYLIFGPFFGWYID